MTVETYLHRGRKWMAALAADHRVRRLGKGGAYFGAGFLMSAAALGHSFQPFAMALVTAFTGWRAGVLALGAGAGYWIFWGQPGLQGSFWALLGGLSALFLGKRKLVQEGPLILPALCAFWVAATGLGWLFLGKGTPTGLYLLRVALAGAGGLLFRQLKDDKEPVLVWLGKSIAVLALAQVPFLPRLNPGIILGAVLALTDAFPAAALGGLALDLAQVTPVSMTAVLCLVYMTRLIPGLPRWVRLGIPGAVYLLAMPLLGRWDFAVLPGLVLGGLCSLWVTPRPDVSQRRGATGVAQVKLELMAQVLTQTRGLMMEDASPPIDEEALLSRTKERACGGCPNRKTCQAPEKLPKEYLHRPLTENRQLDFPCRKAGRMILEIRRTQEQYRRLRADRDRLREYRQAVVQQYGFVSDWLRDLADRLPEREKPGQIRFSAEVGVASRSREPENGDRLSYFAGPGARYFVVLCDGMGTGLGAGEEGRSAMTLLKQMLLAGYPPEHALRSLNSLLVLRGKAGAVTADLAEIRLDTGAVRLYKWGAVPSYLLRNGATEKIGTAGPPPGIRLTDVRETVDRLSLGRGETLIMLSDGVDGEEARRRAVICPEGPAGELAAKLLEAGAADSADDASAAVVRLHPLTCRHNTMENVKMLSKHKM